MTIASMEALIERAVTATDLADFGGDGWQVGLEQLLDGARRDLGSDVAAVTLVENMIVRRLMSRLQVEAWYAERGEDGPPRVEGPLVVVGLPRTGTTALQYLLGVDPQYRYPRQWEMATPVPPPDPATEHEDPRRPTAASRGGDVRHISAVDGPAEDNPIHALNFGSQDMALPLQSYQTWWRRADLTGTFAYQERVLRLLHSIRTPHLWLLKAPAYLFHLPEMSTHYPDARFVMTHRDPTAALPSTCSVVYEVRANMFPGFANPSSLGEEILVHYAQGMQQAMDARAAIGEHRFIDVSQGQVEEDPVGTAERIYGFAGLELSDDVKVQMHDWAAANRRGSRGAHVYRAEDFGLTNEGIRDTFAEYCLRFAAYVSPTSGS
jgi:hypothetical protein